MFEDALLEDASGTLFGSGSDFPDPLDDVKKRRKFGTDEPETWDAMPPGADYAEVLLFTASAKKSGFDCSPGNTDECARALTGPFKPLLLEQPQSLASIVESVAERANYQVLSVTRHQNLPRYSMHRHFGRSYGIKDTRAVYHGTTRTNASTIAKVGFRNAASQRAKFGKGIYAASNVWEALAYAEPEAGSMVQTFLVADLLQGPTRIGTENMVDFGYDDAQRQIITTTNPDQSIFCAAYEDQLYAHYSITVRYMCENPHSPSAHGIVRMYHPAIWSRIKEKLGQQPTPQAPVFAVPLPAPKPQFEELQCHMNYKMGDMVKVVKTFKHYTFCRGAVGHIRKIVKDGRVHFCVELEAADLQKLTKRANKKPVYSWQSDLSWLRCQIGHIEPVAAPFCAPTLASDDAQTGAGSAGGVPVTDAVTDAAALACPGGVPVADAVTDAAALACSAVGSSPENVAGNGAENGNKRKRSGELDEGQHKAAKNSTNPGDGWSHNGGASAAAGHAAPLA